MLDNSKAVVFKISKDLKTISITLDIILQVILLGLSGYNIYNNVDNTVRLVIYSVIAVVQVVWFIIFLAFKRDKHSLEENIENKKVGLFIKYFKLVFRLFLLIFSLVEVFAIEYDTVELILVIISITSFMIQLITTIITHTIINYADLLMVAVKEDFKFVEKTKDIAQKVSNPLYGISSLFIKDKQEIIEDEEKEKKLDKIAEYKEQREAEKEIKATENKLKKEELKEAFNQQKKEVINAFKNKLAEKFNKNDE